MAAKKKQTPKSHNLSVEKPGLKKIYKLWQTKPKGKKVIPKKKLLEQMFEQYFFSLSDTKFVQLTKDWNDEKLNIKLEKQTTYDGWLNYFKTLSVNQLILLSKTGMDILPAEAYAALSFWRDIMNNPSRIKNIHKAGLTGGADGNTKSIAEMAAKNDRYGVLCAIRDELAGKLQKGAGNRDTADLAKQLTEVMTQIADYERRMGKNAKKTVLHDLLSDMPNGSEIKDKRPSRNGGGRRQTSFASRVTIKDVEGK